MICGVCGGFVHPLLGRVGFQGGMTQMVQLMFSSVLSSSAFTALLE